MILTYELLVYQQLWNNFAGYRHRKYQNTEQEANFHAQITKL